MNPVGVVSLGAFFTAVAVAFVLGAAPVFVVRLIARIYPLGDERRAELVAEAAHIKGLGKTFELWRWLGESFALAVCEGIPLRVSRRKKQRLMLVLMPRPHLARDANLVTFSWVEGSATVQRCGYLREGETPRDLLDSFTELGVVPRGKTIQLSCHISALKRSLNSQPNGTGPWP